jgi:AraC-like DNA-binding protein
LWGRPSVEDTRALLQSLPTSGSLLATRMPRLIDVRRLEEVDPVAFALFVDYFKSRSGKISELVERVAVVHGAGLSAALSAGFAHAALVSVPMMLFTKTLEALAWLGAEKALEGELERLQADAAGMSPLVRDLRAFVGAQLREVTLLAAAAAVGLSPRTLQRRLREQRVSFQDEVNILRVQTAKKRLLETDATIAEIATDVGFGSANRFAELFRRVTGELPAKWRAERRSQRRIR